MKILAMIMFIATASTCWAEDSPWFGSEASIAEQIDLNSKETQSQATIVLNTKPNCAIETCPVSDKLAK